MTFHVAGAGIANILALGCRLAGTVFALWASPSEELPVPPLRRGIEATEESGGDMAARVYPIFWTTQVDVSVEGIQL
ncbi:MAG: hypothetical protein AAGB46_06590 [Verrucomicrobiota bacterium]